MSTTTNSDTDTNGYGATVRGFIVSSFIFGGDLEIADDESLMAAGVIDSTGMLELVEFIERQFGIKVDDSELVPENLDTLLAITRLIERKTPKSA